MYSYKIIVVLPFVEAKFQSDNVDADRSQSNIPIVHRSVFPKNTKSTSDMLSLTVFAWEFRDNALWDTL